MKIVSGEVVLDAIADFAEQMLKKIHPYNYEDRYIYENLVEVKDATCLLAFVEDDRVVDLAYQGTLLGLKAVSPYFASTRHQEIIDLIHQEFGDDVILYGCHMTAVSGLVEGNMNSTYRDDWYYHIGSLYTPFWVFTEEKKDIIRDILEEKYLRIDLEKNPVRYELLPMREVYSKYVYNKEFMDYPMECQPGSFSHVMGFHYFGGIDNEPNAKMLVAVANNTVIGCIKYCYYERDKQYGVCYIDVAKSYRNKGIATNMIRALSEKIDGDYPLLLSNESEMGKKCRMHEHFKAYQWPCGLYANGPEYDYVRIA